MANTQTAVPLFVANAVLTAAQQNISAGTGVPVFATTVTRDAAFGGSNKALAEGQLCYIEASNIVQYYDGAAWATVGPQAASGVAIFNEQQASGTGGGTFTSGSWVKRTLNTSVVNTISGCSIASSVITLGAGTYNLTAIAPAYSVDSHKARLQNTTASTTLALGVNGYSASPTGYSVSLSIINVVFTVTGATNLELQQQCQTTKATNGLGITCSFTSINETYSQLQIVQTA